jgi:flagellar basal body-associated protein FliL
MSTSAHSQPTTTTTESKQPEPKNNNKKRLILILLGLAGVVLAGGIIFAATRGDVEKELTQIDPSKETQTVLVEKPKDEDSKQKDDQPVPVQTETPSTTAQVQPDGNGKDGPVKETETATTGLLSKAVVLIKSKSIPVKIAMVVGVVLLLAALGLAIWQVVEISLGNKSILDLVSGGAEGATVPKIDEPKPDTRIADTRIEAAKSRISLRDNRLKATSLATAGAFCLGLGVLLLFVALLKSATIPALVLGLFTLVAGIVLIALAETIGKQWFGTLPNHISYLAVVTGLAVGGFILKGVAANPAGIKLDMALGLLCAILVGLFSFVLPYFSTPDNGLNAFNV